MIENTKSIIFDLGGVIYSIDYHKTINEFKALGVDDFHALYSKSGQSSLFDDFEVGKFSSDFFIENIKILSGNKITNSEIIKAWNAMLIGFIPDALYCLNRLRKSYRLYLLSNTNEIHINEIEKRVGVKFLSDFFSLFEKVYLSHEIGLRKPNHEVFRFILEDQDLLAHETLFVDDSIQHIDSAIKFGINSHHLLDSQSINKLFIKF